jgi:hypothetical protein
MPNSCAAVSNATAQTTLLPALLITPASVRVCCSLACAARVCVLAGLTSSFVTRRSKWFKISAAARITTKWITFDGEIFRR